jgi:DNA-binding LacI/PurR family transcriptional regulator
MEHEFIYAIDHEALTMMTQSPPPSQRSLATAHDVARLAGVSQSAVSRAFTDGASISPATRERVIDAAHALGYRPNVLARSLITGQTKIVGLAMGNVDNPFFTLALDKLSSRLSGRGYRLLLFTTEMNARVDEQIEELLLYRVEAVILLSATMSSKLVCECQKSGIPVILFNRTVTGSNGGYSVTTDNEHGARTIALHLIEAGYTRAAFMAGYLDSSTSQARERGFFETLVESGRAPPLREVGEFTVEGATLAARRLLTAGRRPDAIFCANDHMALITIEVARHEFGLELGNDIGVVGFDDIPLASWASFGLTTYSQPLDAMADRTVDFISRIDDMAREQNVVVPGKLMIRKSTRRSS